MKLTINQVDHQVDVDPDTPLLWVLRDEIGLTGTKFGCGIAMCGACTVHVSGIPQRACSLPVGAVDGPITTIEGLSNGPAKGSANGPGDGGRLHVVQEAWIAHNVAQCGYCQSGQIMTAAALLAENPNPSDDDIDGAMSGNLCRCGTYPRIRAAIHDAARRLKGDA